MGHAELSALFYGRPRTNADSSDHTNSYSSSSIQLNQSVGRLPGSPGALLMHDLSTISNNTRNCVRKYFLQVRYVMKNI